MTNISFTPDTKGQLLKDIARFSGKKVLILGDVGVDEYVMGEVRRISPEAPVPVLEVEQEDLRLGLAANVAQNVTSLGGTPLLVSVMGHDAGADLLTQLLGKNGVGTEYLVKDEKRPTTRKSRVMAKHHHLVRVDYEVRRYLSEEIEARVFEQVQRAMPLADVVIIEDYAKGVVCNSLLHKAIELAKQQNKKILVDPHRSNRGEFYQGVDLIKPNFDEAMALAGINYDDLRDNPDKVLEVGRALQAKTGAKEVVITQGKQGMTIFSGNQVMQVPTYARQVFDVTGAGDTVIATLALGISAGLPLKDSCMLANFAAGVVVGQIGCVPCTVNQLRDYIEGEV